MKRDFLKSLGIEDKDLIDKILDENSADIGRAKGELETYKTKVTDLENKLTTKETELNDAKKSAGDTATLNEKIRQLELDKTNLTNELNTKVSQLQKTHAIEGSVRDAKAKNVKAVMALLDMEKITFENGELSGITEQLENLKKDEASAFMFGDAQGTPPAGLRPNTPPTNGGNPPTTTSLKDAVAKAFTKN